MKNIYMFAGLPGAGKTTAREQAISLTGGDVVHAGTIIRQMAADDGLTDPSSSELANYAAEQRTEQGPAFAAEKFKGLYLRDEIDVAFPLMFDSVRHKKEVYELRETFNGHLIWVDAPFETRLRRLQERGRDDEDTFTAADLEERDHIELEELGAKTIIDNDELIDYRIQNDGGLGNLKSALDAVFHG